MTAHTTDQHGFLIRWHAPPDLTECRSGECERAHATRDELAAIDDLLAEHHYESGRAAERGEL